MQEDLELDNGHFSVLVQRKCGLLSLQSCWTKDDKIQRKRTPSFPCHESIVQLKSKGGAGNDYNFFSHNYVCKSVQFLRNSRKNVWIIWNLSWYNGETCFGRAVEFLIRAKRDQDRRAFFFG